MSELISSKKVKIKMKKNINFREFLKMYGNERILFYFFILNEPKPKQCIVITLTVFYTGLDSLNKLKI